VARVSGTVAISALLALTIYQGYAQYFVAWGNSPETYDAYAEDSVAMANYFNQHPFNGKRYAVSGGYQLQTVEYLTHNHSSYQYVETGDIDKLPLDPGTAKEFAVFENDKDKVLTKLKQKFPEGSLRPGYSQFDGDELFVTYTVPAK
jgi:hypothetical protein